MLPDGTVFFFIRDSDGSVIKFYQPSAGLGLSMAESDSQQLFEFSSTSIGRV